MAAARDKKIGGLDIAMNDSLGVRGVQRIGNFDGEIEEVVELHGAAIDEMLQAWSRREIPWR